MKKYFLCALIMCLPGCFEPSPPKDFEAVIPQENNNARRGCPNLIDTYMLTQAQEFNLLRGAFDSTIDAKDATYFAIEALVADQAYNYVLRMDTSRFISQAQKLQRDDPKKYYHWRDSTLQLRKQYSVERLADVLVHGPAIEQRGQFHVYECKDGWLKAGQTENRVWDQHGESEQVHQNDVWLARDKYGDLLVHIISYREKAGWTFWAAGGAGVRLIRMSDQWHKIRKASDANFTRTWSESDLPAIAKPVEHTRDCRMSEYALVDFNQRLLQNGLIIEKFIVEPPAIKNDACVPPSILLGFFSINSTEGKKNLAALETDSSVHEVELVETRMDANGLHYIVRISMR